MKPDYWRLGNRFDPFYCQGRAKIIARSIFRKIVDKTYVPHSPHEKKIPKSSGGERTLRIYEIPDAVVSKLLYQRLLHKNRHRFSAFSYAYREDRNVHFAIQDLYEDISKFDRLYVAEFDFSDFFGNISHAHLDSQLKSNGLMLSDEDIWLIKRFLLPEKGIPQGTSISLFLANVACLSLDKSLERLGVKFARYADDTVICSHSYESISRAANEITRFSKISEVSVNFEKSQGISLLTHFPGKAEFKAKNSFEFLGYSVSTSCLGIKKSSENKIKKRLSYLAYRNLVQPLKPARLRSVRIPLLRDDDFVTAMMQIRRYIWGGLNKSTLNGYLSRGGGQIRFRGVMSFYPLVTDDEQLRSLDGWLASMLYRTLKLRARLFARHGYPSISANFPYNVSERSFIEALDSHRIGGKRLVEVPSFFLLSRAMRKAMKEHGISYVMDPRSSMYAYRD
ncbi:reverse transcriptase domain-containing protein [Stenotrophomonas sp. 9(2022)]|uniref:reverse transcriptase domain-containing protein n=1 Tax=Stenotrophomonas sp. 9(2022) TaxID=2950153 RepID=UPI002115C11C|nr:reverse transcriptase domain-containing protein [Stenotrophomonas sp. 9(2022)]